MRADSTSGWAPAVQRFEECHGVDHRAPLRAGRATAANVLRLEVLTRPIRRGAPVRYRDFGWGLGHLPAMAALFWFEAWGADRDAWRRRTAAPGLPRLRGATRFPLAAASSCGREF